MVGVVSAACSCIIWRKGSEGQAHKSAIFELFCQRKVRDGHFGGPSPVNTRRHFGDQNYAMPIQIYPNLSQPHHVA
jgi:hypothetical protein